MDFSIDGPVTMLSAMSFGQRALNSSQKRSSGQSSSLVVEIALDVVAAQHRIAHRGKRETAAVIAVDNLGIGRRLRHDAEPAERIALLVGP